MQLLKYIKHWGGTGVLLEYEDTFPYSGELSPLAGKHAYTYAYSFCFTLITDFLYSFREDLNNKNIVCTC